MAEVTPSNRQLELTHNFAVSDRQQIFKRAVNPSATAVTSRSCRSPDRIGLVVDVVADEANSTVTHDEVRTADVVARESTSLVIGVGH